MVLVARRSLMSRLQSLVSMSKFVFQWGFLPFIIYLGFRQGPEPNGPPLSFASLLWA